MNNNETNLVEFPAALSLESKKLIRIAIGSVVSAQDQLRQAERQLWNVLDQSSNNKYGIQGPLLALNVARGIIGTGKNNSDQATEMITDAILYIEERR